MHAAYTSERSQIIKFETCKIKICSLITFGNGWSIISSTGKNEKSLNISLINYHRNFFFCVILLLLCFSYFLDVCFFLYIFNLILHESFVLFCISIFFFFTIESQHNIKKWVTDCTKIVSRDFYFNVCLCLFLSLSLMIYSSVFSGIHCFVVYFFHLFSFGINIIKSTLFLPSSLRFSRNTER